MGIDIRLTLGILFSLLGVTLVIYGIAGDPSLYRQSLGININLYWGTVLLGFGTVMLLLGRRGIRAANITEGGTRSTPRGR
jgi:hypothetical protein